MTLESWVNYGWLVRHQSNRREIQDLLSIADRDIEAAQIAQLPPDWRLNIAYNAALQTANAALAANGYRAEHASQHYRMIQSLEHTLGLDAATISQIDTFRKKRNVSSYDRSGSVSDLEADEMLRLAKEIRAKFEEWLRTNKPELFE